MIQVCGYLAANRSALGIGEEQVVRMQELAANGS